MIILFTVEMCSVLMIYMSRTQIKEVISETFNPFVTGSLYIGNSPGSTHKSLLYVSYSTIITGLLPQIMNAMILLV
jgi:hypothetical protein